MWASRDAQGRPGFRKLTPTPHRRAEQNCLGEGGALGEDSRREGFRGSSDLD